MATMTSPTPRHLEGRKFYNAVLSLNGINAITFLDITAATVILTAVPSQFSGNEIVTFAAPAQLIGATIGQALLGYLSEIWSRKSMLMLATSTLLMASILGLLSHFTSSAGLFVVARAFAGVATGSISSLVNIAQNDFSLPKRRLKYQGLQGISVALGSSVGSLVAAALVEKAWWAFYVIQAFFSVVGFLLVCLYIPANVQKPTWVELRDVVKRVDWAGIVMFSATLTTTLLLICKANTFGASVKVGLGVTAAATGVAFLYIEWCQPIRGVRPLIPFQMFKNRTISIVVVQNICVGFAYYAFIFLLPTTLTAVRRWSLLKAAAFMVPYFAVHAAWTTASAHVLRWLQKKSFKSYSYIFYFGYAIWMLAMSLIGYDCTRELGHGNAIIVLAALTGFGTGSVFQNSVMAITQQAPAEHKAMALSIRNVARFLGGVFGTAVNQVVLGTTLERLQWIAKKSIYQVAMEKLGDDRVIVEKAYANGAGLYFYIMIAVLGVAFLLNPLVQDLPKEKEADVEKWLNGDASESSVEASAAARGGANSEEVEQAEEELVNG